MEHTIQSPQTDAQSLDRIYGLLSNQRRRHVVAAVSERTSPVPIHTLASTVVEIEREAEDGPVTSVEDVVAALHHIHLPKLDDAGVIDYDVETNVVTPHRTDVLAPFVEPADEFE